MVEPAPPAIVRAVEERNMRMLRRKIDQQLSSAVESALLRAMAHARLEQAVATVVAEVDHRSVTLDSKMTEHGRSYRLRFLGSVLMTWSFVEQHVDVCFSPEGRSATPGHIRFRFVPLVGEWRMSLPGQAVHAGTFTDEGEKVIEMLSDAICAISGETEPLTPLSGD